MKILCKKKFGQIPQFMIDSSIFFAGGDWPNTIEVIGSALMNQTIQTITVPAELQSLQDIFYHLDPLQSAMIPSGIFKKNHPKKEMSCLNQKENLGT